MAGLGPNKPEYRALKRCVEEGLKNSADTLGSAPSVHVEGDEYAPSKITITGPSNAAPKDRASVEITPNAVSASFSGSDSLTAQMGNELVNNFASCSSKMSPKLGP
jgi:hypothetical protein